MKTYTTKQGDMWDSISYAVYGSTAYTGKLMKANLEHSSIFIFPANIVLNVPEIETTDSDISFIPPWRR